MAARAVEGLRGMGPKLYLTETEVSDVINVPRRTLQAWRYQGRGPRYVKLGGAVRYRITDLEKYLAMSTRTTTDDN